MFLKYLRSDISKSFHYFIFSSLQNDFHPFIFSNDFKCMISIHFPRYFFFQNKINIVIKIVFGLIALTNQCEVDPRRAKWPSSIKKIWTLSRVLSQTLKNSVTSVVPNTWELSHECCPQHLRIQSRVLSPTLENSVTSVVPNTWELSHECCHQHLRAQWRVLSQTLENVDFKNELLRQLQGGKTPAKKCEYRKM